MVKLLSYLIDRASTFPLCLTVLSGKLPLLWQMARISQEVYLCHTLSDRAEKPALHLCRGEQPQTLLEPQLLLQTLFSHDHCRQLALALEDSIPGKKSLSKL